MMMMMPVVIPHRSSNRWEGRAPNIKKISDSDLLLELVSLLLLLLVAIVASSAEAATLMPLLSLTAADDLGSAALVASIISGCITGGRYSTG